MNDFFNELDESEQQSTRNAEPFFRQPYGKDDEHSQKKLLTWLNNEKSHLLSMNKSRFENIKKNMALNKGIMYQDQDTRNSNSREASSEVKKRMVQKIVINVLREANRVRASKILKYKPAVAILPTNDELGDKVAAEACEKLKDHIWYTQRFDGEKLPNIINAKGPMGEAFLFIEWNPELGDLHEEYKAASEFAKKNKMSKVPILNDQGKPDTDDQGKTIYVDKPVRNGDVAYSVEYPVNLLFQRPPTRQFEDSEYVFRRQMMSVDKARLKWPKAADKIKGSKDSQFYDFDSMSSYQDPNMVEVWTFYHKRTDELDDGRMVIFTQDGILDDVKFPYSHRRLPCVRWVDLTNPGEMHGVSFFEDVRGPAGAFNNITNMILRNEILVGHPKWMMPAGAAKIEDLGNSVTVVQWKGPTPPQLVQANPTGQGAYNLRNTLQEEVFRQADVSRTGNGNPPQGVTAAVAMQYLAELESERWNEPVLHHNEAILQTVTMTLAVAGDYYDPTDKRMMRVQGKDGEWTSEFFDAAYLSKDYDVRIQGSSALPESKAARIETLIFLAEKFPDRVDSEQVLDMFDLAQSKKFAKEGTLSLKAAEAENEMILSAKKIAPPEPYEDHVTHWRTHVRKMRDWSFKNRTPEAQRKALEDHVMAHEMFMAKLALKDPAFAQALAALSGFPIFFKPMPEPSADPAPKMEEEMMMPDPIATGPMQLPPEMPVQQPGEEVAPEMPPLPQQEGLEPMPQEPTSGV